jgi:hypothetical protein
MQLTDDEITRLSEGLSIDSPPSSTALSNGQNNNLCKNPFYRIAVLEYANVSNWVIHIRLPSFQVGRMVGIRHWIFGSIYGFRWLPYEFGS